MLDAFLVRVRSLVDGPSDEATLRRYLAALEPKARQGALAGCLACHLTAELCHEALSARGLEEARRYAQEAGRYATRGSIYGCSNCAKSVDLICDGGAYRSR